MALEAPGVCSARQLVHVMMGFSRRKEVWPAVWLPGPIWCLSVGGSIRYIDMHKLLKIESKQSTYPLQHYSEPILSLVLGCFSACHRTSFLSLKRGWVVLSHCKVIRGWATQRDLSAGFHVLLVMSLTVAFNPLTHWTKRYGGARGKGKSGRWRKWMYRLKFKRAACIRKAGLHKEQLWLPYEW